MTEGVATVPGVSLSEVGAPASAPARRTAEWRVLGLPISLWTAIASTLCMLVGWNWDISWHRCIGRDTVWTPAHVAIYVALALAFLYNVYLLASFTFGRRRNSPALRILGLRAPAGSYLTLWGVLLQFVSILFDNWWHNVYGLDIAVFSPPHALLARGINFFYFGQIVLVIRYHNRAVPEDASTRWVMQVLWALLLGHCALALDPSYGVMGVRNRLYVATSTYGFVPLMVIVHQYLGRAWAATTSSAIYMLLIVIIMQVAQLFPATPRLAPIFHEVDGFFPPLFPLLLVVPAAAVDLVLHRAAPGRPWRTSLLVAAVFVVTFNVTNWLASAFLSSEWAVGRVFGGGYPGSAFEPDFRIAPHLGLDIVGVIAVVSALGMGLLMARVSFPIAGWLRRIER